MASPVAFTLTLATLPVDFEGTAQELAQAIVDRLTIEPAEPWNSFQVTSSIPDSDVGPVLYEGVEWRVFDEGDGAYTYLRVHGAGIIEGTIPQSAIKTETGQANKVFVWDNSGAPSAIAGTDGQFLKSVAGVPTFVDAEVVHSYAFRAVKSSSSQAYTAGSGQARIVFDQESYDLEDVFDSNVFTVPADGVYDLKASVHTQKETGTPTGIDRILSIRVNGSAVSWSKPQINSSTDGETIAVADQIQLSEGDVVDVALEINTTGSSGWSVQNNGVETHFSGRLVALI